MEYVVTFIAGAAASASALAIWYFTYISRLRIERRAIKDRERELSTEETRVQEHVKSLEAWRLQANEAFAAQNNDLENRRQEFQNAAAAFESRKVQYEELVRENGLLKQDLFNFSVQIKKMERDHAAIIARQEEIAKKSSELGERYLNENVAWIGAKLTSKNFAGCKDRLLNVIEACRGIGFDVSVEKEESLVENLRKHFEEAVRQEFAREEQARIRAQIREEEKLARETQKQIQEAEREKAAVKAALEKALKEAKDEYSAEVEYWKGKLKEAEEKAQHAISQAQLTKAGHVYVLSNIGSFGEGVFKIGMTRRLEPIDRVNELGNASVPFPFDVHMMISCDDAPGLENALHKEFHRQRVNRVNFHKEFYRVDLACIREFVEANRGEVAYVAEPAALEYRESMSMKDEDFDFVERTVQGVIGVNGDSVTED